MGRKPVQIVKGNHSQCFYFLYSKADMAGKFPLKMRVKIDKQKKVIDLPVIINREKIRIIKQHFNSGRVTGGYANDSINKINLILVKRSTKAIEIADQFYKNKKELTAPLLSLQLERVDHQKDLKKDVIGKEFELSVTEPLPSEYARELRFKYPKRREIETIRSIDHEGFEVIEKKEIIIDPLSLDDFNFPKHFPAELYQQLEDEYLHNTGKTKQQVDRFIIEQFVKFRATILLTDFQSKSKIKIDSEVISRYENETNRVLNTENDLPFGGKSKILKIKNDIDLKKLTVEERYKRGLFDKTNIYECFGYIRFMTVKDAAGDDVPIINSTFHRVMNNLYLYRYNAHPSEHIDHFNEDWAHEFYKWLRANGAEPKSHKASHSPWQDGKRYKLHNVKPIQPSSFKQVDKRLKMFIKGMYRMKFIPNNFSDRIEANAFIKDKTEKKDTYKFLQIKEFLTILNNKLKNKELEETRKLFMLQTLIGGQRISDINSKRISNNYESFSTIEYNQKKTGGLIKTVLLKPVQEILKDFVIPEKIEEQKYNENLKLMLKEFVKEKKLTDRKIKFTKTFLNGKVEEIEKPLSDMITSRFARSTMYVLAGAINEPLEKTMSRTGHTQQAIVMKHYYAIGKNYDDSDIEKLLQLFKK